MNDHAPRFTSDTLLQALDELGAHYELVEHEAVFTVEEALAATPVLGGIKTKNVFLRDSKGSRHLLVIVPHHKRLNLAELSNVLGTSKLSMGSPERLLRHLGVTPGSVSVFALVNDTTRQVELIVDESVWEAEKIQGHPLRNTATVAIGRDALEKFLAHTEHQPRVLPVP